VDLKMDRWVKKIKERLSTIAAAAAAAA